MAINWPSIFLKYLFRAFFPLLIRCFSQYMCMKKFCFPFLSLFLYFLVLSFFVHFFLFLIKHVDCCVICISILFNIRSHMWAHRQTDGRTDRRTNACRLSFRFSHIVDMIVNGCEVRARERERQFASALQCRIHTFSWDFFPWFCCYFF